MTLGSRLGSYEITGQIGAGGMGEVYSARDTRLNRNVAVKLLPESFAADADRLRRFELEAQTAGGLNHPNVIVVHDLGVDSGRAYIVTELLEGETLRERLRAGKLPVQKAVDYARQAAAGLAAAHIRGIVHRDIKPENLFVTRDGRIKILDFGLAKMRAARSVEESATLTVATDPGSVLGTLGYMAPEQVRGKEVDQRADIFALGCVLYEMLTGERAFHGETAADTMSAILNKDPLEVPAATVSLPPHLERIVRHCLEKGPDERFQSARDLAFDLGSLTAVSTSPSATGMTAPSQRGRAWKRVAAVGVAAILALAAAFYAGARTAVPSQPHFQRLTYRRGIIQSARFAPGGNSVVYAAAWDGGPIELYSLLPGNPESRSFGVPPAGLFAVSPAGEVTLALSAKFVSTFSLKATLAQVPLVGGTPREILDEVESADYSPATHEFAVVMARSAIQPSRLEYPPGKAIVTGKGSEWQSHVRISPKGDLVAFADHYYNGDDGYVSVVDRTGKKRVLTATFTSLEGVAWGPSGDEVWFTGAREGAGRALYAVSLSGRLRLLAAGPGTMTLYDVDAAGRALVSSEEFRQAIECVTGDSPPKDLSWMDWSTLNSLSPDGKMIVLTESGEGVRGLSSIFVRRTDGSAAVKIGEGLAGSLSPDGRWVLSREDNHVRLLPVRAGTLRALDSTPIAQVTRTAWLPDGQHILINGNEKGKPARCWIQSISGPPQPITPEGETGVLVTPDGSAAITRIGDGFYQRRLTGGEAKALPLKFDPNVQLVQISSDGRWVFVRAETKIYRVELATGKRELWREIRPSNPVGVRAISSALITPDGNTYAYRLTRDLGELYLLEGVR